MLPSHAFPSPPSSPPGPSPPPPLPPPSTGPSVEMQAQLSFSSSSFSAFLEEAAKVKRYIEGRLLEPTADHRSMNLLFNWLQNEYGRRFLRADLRQQQQVVATGAGQLTQPSSASLSELQANASSSELNFGPSSNGGGSLEGTTNFLVSTPPMEQQQQQQQEQPTMTSAPLPDFSSTFLQRRPQLPLPSSSSAPSGFGQLLVPSSSSSASVNDGNNNNSNAHFLSSTPVHCTGLYCNGGCCNASPYFTSVDLLMKDQEFGGRGSGNGDGSQKSPATKTETTIEEAVGGEGEGGDKGGESGAGARNSSLSPAMAALSPFAQEISNSTTTTTEVTDGTTITSTATATTSNNETTSPPPPVPLLQISSCTSAPATVSRQQQYQTTTSNFSLNSTTSAAPPSFPTSAQTNQNSVPSSIGNSSINNSNGTTFFRGGPSQASLRLPSIVRIPSRLFTQMMFQMSQKLSSSLPPPPPPPQTAATTTLAPPPQRLFVHPLPASTPVPPGLNSLIESLISTSSGSLCHFLFADDHRFHLCCNSFFSSGVALRRHKRNCHPKYNGGGDGGPGAPPLPPPPPRRHRCTWFGCGMQSNYRQSVAQHVRREHLKVPVTLAAQRRLGLTEQTNAYVFVATNGNA
ncbi:hypothetical protein TYRP_019477 [Tyrophagus putrescentiae]|nr:hypothetical protein TYRP_019477 [Tyrophagus putrescentiae]